MKKWLIIFLIIISNLHLFAQPLSTQQVKVIWRPRFMPSVTNLDSTWNAFWNKTTDGYPLTNINLTGRGINTVTGSLDSFTITGTEAQILSINSNTLTISGTNSSVVLPSSSGTYSVTANYYPYAETNNNFRNSFLSQNSTHTLFSKPLRSFLNNTEFDIDNGIFNDENGSIALRFSTGDRKLFNGATSTVYDWENGYMYENTGNYPVIDIYNTTLKTTEGIQRYNWNSGDFYDLSGSDIILSLDSRSLGEASGATWTTTTQATNDSSNAIQTTAGCLRAIAAYGGGGGGVTSVIGTANKITVNGVATPTVTIASTYAGQPSIVTTGTITAGGWEASPIKAIYGGTGRTSYTVGDFLQATTTTTLTPLSSGVLGSYLRGGGAGTVNAWSTLTLPNSATATNIVYATGTNALGSTSTFCFDATGNLIVGRSAAAFTNDIIGAERSVASTLAIRLKNTSTSNGAYSQLAVGNSSTLVNLGLVGTNTTTSGEYVQGQAYNMTTSAGYSFGTNNASGVIRIYTGSGVQNVNINASGRTFFGGSTSATAWLQVAAGTTTVSPVKLTNGTLETTPETGAMEMASNILYFTPNASRYQIGMLLTGSATLDFGNTSPQNSSDLTITVTGASDGDPVTVGAPNGSVLSNSSYSAFVSASNTVTVRFNNYSSGSQDPASGTFKVTVNKN